MIYFNAAKYSAGKFRGFMSMMDIKNIKKDGINGKWWGNRGIGGV